MKSFLSFYIFFSLISTNILFINSPIFAQDSVNVLEKTSHWINVGLGISTFGMSTGLNFSFESDNKLYSVSFTHNNEFNILGPSPAETIWDVGFLYGLLNRTKHSLISISAGISLVGGIKRGKFISSSGWFSSKYAEKDFLTLGIPVEAELYWRPFKIFGLGLYGFANLNSIKSFSGALVSLQFIVY